MFIEHVMIALTRGEIISLSYENMIKTDDFGPILRVVCKVEPY